MQLPGFQPGSHLADYRLETRVGSGGMAVVYRARDERLERPVALKILAPWLTTDGTVRQRFIAESRAAAAVDDPNIIPVYEAGEANGVLFIAMRFVHGGDLRGVLQREGALSPARAAGFISPVASALDAAHRAGLVHRDVKPGNILVDTRPDRPDHVYLSDFGISKGASTGLTGTGKWIGTADYTAPEQIQGRVVDGRADQYALACVAFELLTGSVPFERDGELALLYAHATDPPPSLTSRRPGLPAAADEVMAKALAKVPEKRYGSCREFADALREALGLSPYHSTTESAADRAGTGVTGPEHAPQTVDSEPSGLDIVTSAGGAGHEPVIPGPADLPPVPDWDSGQGLVRPVRGTRRRLVAVVGLAVALLAGAGITTAVLLNSVPGPGATFVVPEPGVGAVSVAFSPNGKILAAGTADSHIDLWNIATGKQITSLTDPVTDGIADDVNSLAFSPDGTLLAAGDGNGHSYLWNVAGGRLIATLTASSSAQSVNTVAFSPDGTLLAAGDLDGSTYVWNVASRQLVATLTDPGSVSTVNVNSVAFSPDGQTLAAGDQTGSTYLWNIASKSLTATLTASPGDLIESVAFSPDGKTLAAGDETGSTYLWNLATRTVTVTLYQSDGKGVGTVAFSSDGQTLATGDNDGPHTYVWDVATSHLITTFTDPGHSNGVNGVAFSPDGKTVATADGDGSTYLWDVR